jgi:hypothetical protein
MTDQTAPSPTPVTGTPAGWYLDAGSGRNRWWDGSGWTENFQTATTAVAIKNGPATASLILGIIGIVLMAIPLFIGLFLGGIPDIIAVILGIVGLTNQAAKARIGRGMAITGIILGGVSLLSVFLGAGTIW